MQLDISSSIFDIVVDDISSGLDPSASNYTVSSSFPNGNLVRLGGPTSTSQNATTNVSTEGVTTTTTTSTNVSTAGASTSGSISY